MTVVLTDLPPSNTSWRPPLLIVLLLATPDKKTSWSPNSTVPIATPAEKTP